MRLPARPTHRCRPSVPPGSPVVQRSSRRSSRRSEHRTRQRFRCSVPGRRHRRSCRRRRRPLRCLLRFQSLLLLRSCRRQRRPLRWCRRQRRRRRSLRCTFRLLLLFRSLFPRRSRRSSRRPSLPPDRSEFRSPHPRWSCRSPRPLQLRSRMPRTSRPSRRCRSCSARRSSRRRRTWWGTSRPAAVAGCSTAGRHRRPVVVVSGVVWVRRRASFGRIPVTRTPESRCHRRSRPRRSCPGSFPARLRDRVRSLRSARRGRGDPVHPNPVRPSRRRSSRRRWYRRGSSRRRTNPHRPSRAANRNRSALRCRRSTPWPVHSPPANRSGTSWSGAPRVWSVRSPGPIAGSSWWRLVPVARSSRASTRPGPSSRSSARGRCPPRSS